MLTSGGYPENYEKGKVISGLENLDSDIVVFHSGTKFDNENIVTNGGRVIGITAKGKTVKEAGEKVYENIKKIKDIFSYSHFFGFGPRHSVGKNSFKLISIEEIKRKPNLNNKLLLSQSVFDECINLSESNYQIISKQYHPSKTYINKTTHKMNLFNEGSYLKLTQDKEWIGKILSFNIDKKPLYYYGIGYII